MKSIRRLTVAVVMITAVSLSACGTMDVVKTDSVRAFGEIINAANPAQSDSLWQLTAPDGTAALLWDGGSVEMTVDAAPFVNAGLDVAKISGVTEGDPARLTFGREFEAKDGAGDTSIADFESLMNTGRDSLEFHITMDHFNLLMDGGMFMWAKDMAKNESSGKDQQHDIAFIVDPKPLIEAGVDPAKIDGESGWVYVPLSLSVDGKMTPVDMFMKSVNLS